MATPQQQFLEQFKTAFAQRFDDTCLSWQGGQRTNNTAGLPINRELRRNGRSRRQEQFEIGDLRTTFQNREIIVEYDSGPVAVHNLVKHWAYITGALTIKPQHPLILCHFSNWGSYASHRELWAWTLLKMKADTTMKFGLDGRQFDHGGDDPELRCKSIDGALCWIGELVA